MRTLVFGLEAYHVDNNEYVQPTGNGKPTRLTRLSTPITYLTRPRLPDAFNDVSAGRLIAHDIEYWGCNDQQTALGSHADGEMIPDQFGDGEHRVLWYFLRSSGPDNNVNGADANGDGSASYKTWSDPAKLAIYLYDPTNGTISYGDLFRAGGEVAGPFNPSATLVMQAR
jgi:hypothetical protein